MKVTGSLQGGAPIFVVEASEVEPWTRAWGAAQQPEGRWFFPAYYPFGEWAFNDLRTFERTKMVPALEWEPSAIAHVTRLKEDREAWLAAEAAYAAGEEPALDQGLTFHVPPYRHQRLGIALVTHRWRDFLLWEMGTGKTKTVIDGMRALRRKGEFRRAVVIAPPVVIPTWEREIDKTSRGEFTHEAWDGSDDARLSADFVIVSYARVRLEALDSLSERRPNRLVELDFDTLVADESHNIGNWESLQTRAVMGLSACGKAARRSLLSGTAADHPSKLYPQLRFLSPGLMQMEWHKFCDRYLKRHAERKYLIIGFQHLNELNAKVDLVASRMKKKDCLDLPPMTVTDVPFRLGPRQRARYNELVVEMQASFAPALGYADPVQFGAGPVPVHENPVLFGLPHGAARVNKLLQVTSGFLIVGPDSTICDACPQMEVCVAAKIKPYTKACRVIQTPPPRQVLRDVENPKLEMFEQLLSNVLESDDTNKVICWGCYLPELDDMEATCKKLKVGYVRVDGETIKDIRAIEDRFAGDEKCRVYVGQVRSGVGISLTSANYAIYYALPWDMVQYHQSLERNNRPGQTRAMTVYRLLAEGTVQEFVAQILAHKDHLAYTLVEKIACAQCDQQARCAPAEIRPFRQGCKYQSESARPIAKVGVVR